MDSAEYMPMFLAESREHLEQLNLAIVALEENPRDRDTVNEIFRVAHSMKGMSATMGFAKIAELTHQMEDVFELLRQRDGGLSTEAIDTVFACLDALSASVDAIEADGEEELDPELLIKRLQSLVRPRTPDQVEREETAGQEVEREDPADGPDLTAVIAAQQEGTRVLHVEVALDQEVMMPAVRAHMIFSALAEHGELVGTSPPQESLDGFQGRQVEAWIATEHEESVVAGSAQEVTDVIGVTVTEADALESQPPLAQPGEAAPDAAPEAAPAPQAAAPEPTKAKEEKSQAPAKAAHPSGRPDASKTTRTVRVDAERLDALMHSMGELVIHRTAVEALIAGVEVPGLQQAVQELTRSSQALQAMVMQVRMIPVDVVFLRFPRLVRDIASKLGKEVKLNLVGTETELDRTVVDALGDPLVHLVRNALDHGLEPPAERVAAGKPEVGTLEIAARHAGGSVVIEVSDDGHGIDPTAVARKAVSLGLLDEQSGAELDMKGAIELLFAPGFTTSAVANDLSGRGVGMDAVRASIRALGGEVFVESSPGRGTQAQIRLPLTLAIVSALQIDVAGAPFAIPLDRVERTLRLSEQRLHSVAGRKMLALDDGVLPLLDGAKVFGRQHHGSDHEFVVIVRAQERRMALAVDDLVGQRELVTRPLPQVVSDGEPVSGGAVLADGHIALIIDCDALSVQAQGASLGVATKPTTPSSFEADQLAA